MLTRRQFSLTALAISAAQLARADSDEAVIPDFSFASIDGGLIRLSDFRDKPVLVVNTASFCAYTPQYDALQALYEEYQDRALILAIPSDDFGGQEFATEAEVKDFCEARFDLTLPMTEITHVRGAQAHPFYVWAAAQGVRPGWNFHKILLDGAGNIRADFPSQVQPDAPALTGALDAALASG